MRNFIEVSMAGGVTWCPVPIRIDFGGREFNVGWSPMMGAFGAQNKVCPSICECPPIVDFTIIKHKPNIIINLNECKPKCT
jgi:hypothetical protein